MKRLILAAAALAVPVIATSAQAASVLSLGSNNIKFQNFEAVFHAGTGIEETNPTYTPVAGDYIVGIAQITTINGTLQDGTLTGVFVQQVAPGPLAVPGVPLTAADRNTFTDSTGHTFTVNINNAGGEIFRFFENGSNTFDAHAATLQGAFNSVQTGSLYLSLGETAGGVNNPSNTAGYEYSLLGVGGLVAKTFAGFNLLVNNTGLHFLEVNDPNESTVSGGLLGDSPTSPSPVPGIDGIVTLNDAYFQSDISQNTIGASLFTLQSADPAFLSTPVPAPASVWGGLALLGALGALRARKVLA